MEWMSRSQYSLRIPFELSQGITALRLPIGLKRSIAELVFQFAANVRGPSLSPCKHCQRWLATHSSGEAVGSQARHLQSDELCPGHIWFCAEKP